MRRTSESNKKRGVVKGMIASLLVSSFAITALAVTPKPSKHVELKGLIAKSDLWSEYKARFVERSGRVVDNANKNVSHSEGQGFSMLMAVAANDPITFDRIWDFTRENMMVRRDNLIAWRWSPNGFSRVRDKNNATDGDIFVAWALLEAAKAGFPGEYKKAARAILKDLRPLAKKDGVFGWWMRPAAFGFDGQHHKGREIINLSYWVFPALERLTVLTGDPLWRGVAASGNKMIAIASQNRAGLPTDWSAFKRNSGKIGTSYKFKSEFSYNAVRIPLYLAWSAEDKSKRLRAFKANWVDRGSKLARIDVKRNRVRGHFTESGYRAVAAVVDCSVSGQKFPGELRGGLDKHYYPASLHLLSIIATKQRYPQCW